MVHGRQKASTSVGNALLAIIISFKDTPIFSLYVELNDDLSVLHWWLANNVSAVCNISSIFNRYGKTKIDGGDLVV